MRPYSSAGYRGSIFQTVCDEDTLLLSDYYFTSENYRVSAYMVVNDAINFVFNELDFTDYNCTDRGVECNTDDGIITIGDDCLTYDCNPTCAPYMFGYEPPAPSEPELESEEEVVSEIASDSAANASSN